MKKEMNNKGFSLVELIIVIAIMVILVAVLAPQYLRYVEKSRVSTDTQTAVEFINALQVVASDPDITLDTTKDYSVSSAANSNQITSTTELIDILTKTTTDSSGNLEGLGLMESTAFSGTTSTSKFQSSAYKAQNIKLELDYDTTSKLWKVKFTGLDNTGALATTTP